MFYSEIKIDARRLRFPNKTTPQFRRNARPLSSNSEFNLQPIQPSSTRQVVVGSQTQQVFVGLQTKQVVVG